MSETVKLFAKMFLVIAVIFTVFLYIFAIILGPALFYFTPHGLDTGTQHLSTLTIWFLNISADIPIGLSLSALFFGIWSIFTLSFVAAWKLRENFHKVIKESIIQPTRKLFNSSLFALPIINSMTLIAVVAIQSLQEARGIPTGTSPVSSDPFLAFVDLSYSAVIEEVGFRVIPIGAFIVFYMFATKRTAAPFSVRQKLKHFFASILFPDKAKGMVGAKTVNEHGIIKGISLGEWGVIVFTSIIFGLAHFNPGVSWEIGKITSATFAGFVLGFSYIVYGAHAAIIIHWFFNTYTKTFLLFSDIYPVAVPFANTVWILSLILGIFGWIAAATLVSLKLVKMFEKRGENLQSQDVANLPISSQ